jgi:hypothetical protein
VTYRIVSHRIGTLGDIYEPEAGVNVEALLVHGFIVEDKAPPKSAKTITNNPKD